MMKVLINSGKIFPFFASRRFLVQSMKDAGYEICLSGFQDDLIEECEQAGLGYQYIPIERTGLNPFADLKAIRAYIRFIKQYKPDVVHSYTAKPNIYGSIGARLAGVKKIYPTVNGLGYGFTGNDRKTKLIRLAMCFLYKIAFSCATKVFFQNADDAEEMVRRRVIKREKCVIISGTGISLEEFVLTPMNNTNTFFLASRLLITKGLRTYFEAAKIVKKVHPEARFLLAGALDPNPDGIKEEELSQVVNEGIVEYLGVIPVEQMNEAMRECSVYVLPSFYREGVPHAILEAMSTGRAILTTNSPGCKETVKDIDGTGAGRNGFLIEPKNSRELAERMIWMIEHPESVKQMGLESFKYAEERFDVKKVNAIMLETMGI